MAKDNARSNDDAKSGDTLDNLLAELGLGARPAPRSPQAADHTPQSPEPRAVPANPTPNSTPDRPAGHTIDSAEDALGQLPAMPANQGLTAKDASRSVDDDPSVKNKPDTTRQPLVGEALNSLFAPPATSVARSTGGDEALGQALLACGAISAQQLAQAQQVLKASPGRRLVELLMEQGGDEEKIQPSVAAHFGLPFERVDLAQGIDGGFDGKLLQRLGPDFCKANSVLPLRVEGQRVALGVTRPDDVLVIDDVRQRLGVKSIKTVIVTAGDVRKAIELVVGASVDDSAEQLADILADVSETDVEVERDESAEIDLESEGTGGPVIRYVNHIVQTAVKEGASDIHIEPSDKKLKVRFRIDGRLFEMMNPPISMAAAITSRIKIMANLDISERRLPQDGKIRCTVAGRKLDLRVSTLPCQGGNEKTVMRLLDTRSIQVKLEQLGFGELALEQWKNLIDAPHGIVLVTGPTGSGKTTTLYASLQGLDRVSMNISTVEDPIEYALDGITQTQMHEKIGMTFGRALKALLRQDPDVIMLGEIRDLETAVTAIQASLTGHLVLSTLHTNDAPSSVTRLVNIGVEPFLVAAAINGVLAQRLVRKLCQHCRYQGTPEGEMANFLEMQGLSVDAVWLPKGCDKCRQTGYSGRLGIYELLVIDDQTRDAIARNPNVAEFRRYCVERGMITLRQDGIEKVRKGITTVEEVLRVTEAAV